MRLNSLNSSSLLALALASASLAGPVTTVPWNGHTGAVSYTYDDARASQIPYLLPQLDSLGIKATFFISIQTIGNFNALRSQWMQEALKGHELTNHTYSHSDLKSLDSATVTTMTKAMADTLRAISPAIQSVTFAYPNCNLPSAGGKTGINAENFVARGCNGSNYAWNTQPADWMNIQGLILSPTSVNSAVTLQNTAKTNNAWVITIVHDVVDPTPDQYSLTPANNRIMVNAGISNKLWIDTYSTVGAYYRAHFTMDTAKAVANGAGWKLQWVSPHPKMPKSVPLRVKLDSTVFTGPILVTQGDTTITRQSDGAYVVDFMKLRLDVNPDNGTAVARARAFRYAPLRTRVTGREVLLRGLPAGSYGFTLADARGAVVERRTLRSGGGETAFTLNAAPRSGVYQLELKPAFGSPRTVSLLILQ